MPFCDDFTSKIRIGYNARIIPFRVLDKDGAAIELAENIRKLGIPAQVFFKKPGKALEYANSYQIPYVIFLGEEEAKAKKVKLKNMKTGQEELISQKDLKNKLI